VIRKLLIGCIFLSMTLHCGFRLGFLDQLYKNRYAIAVSIGLITEVPIPVCSSDHDYRTCLTINTTDQADASVPVTVRAEPINLFIVPVYSLQPSVAVIFPLGSRPESEDFYNLLLVNRLFRPPLPTC
jgi:hypothetical protein